MEMAIFFKAEMCLFRDRGDRVVLAEDALGIIVGLELL
jgi:hypothetical protein